MNPVSTARFFTFDQKLQQCVIRFFSLKTTSDSQETIVTNLADTAAGYMYFLIFDVLMAERDQLCFQLVLLFNTFVCARFSWMQGWNWSRWGLWMSDLLSSSYLSTLNIRTTRDIESKMAYERSNEYETTGRVITCVFSWTAPINLQENIWDRHWSAHSRWRTIGLRSLLMESFILTCFL